MPELTVASFNVHAGVDGWGRPFDLVSACAALDADVLVLAEAFWTSDGTDLVAQLCARLGYTERRVACAKARRLGPEPGAGPTWGPTSKDSPRVRNAVYLPRSENGFPPARRRRPAGGVRRPSETGDWGVALLSRLPVRASEVLDLGRMPRDLARRAAIRLEVELEGRPVTVVGTHMSHLEKGSVVQFARLRRATSGLGDAVLAGDMNAWRPVVTALLPGWHEAVRGATWPAWSPRHQIDHLLVRGNLEVCASSVGKASGSDHLPIRARLLLA